MLPEQEEVLRKANCLDLTKLKTELLSSTSIPEEFKKQSENLLTEYRRFLALKVIFGDTSPPLNLSPSAIVDSVWHLHLLMPAHYSRCCKQLGEELIDHDSSTARDHEDIRKKRLEMTKRSYKVAFGDSPPDRFWALTYQHVAECESTSPNGPSEENRDSENETAKVFNILVKPGYTKQFYVKMKRKEKVFKQIEELLNTDSSEFYLRFNSKHIKYSDTPDSLQMKEGDYNLNVIEVTLRLVGC